MFLKFEQAKVQQFKSAVGRSLLAVRPCNCPLIEYVDRFSGLVPS